jgi:hypothetical protein
MRSPYRPAPHQLQCTIIRCYLTSSASARSTSLVPFPVIVNQLLQLASKAACRFAHCEISSEWCHTEPGDRSPVLGLTRLSKEADRQQLLSILPADLGVPLQYSQARLALWVFFECLARVSLR